MTKRSSLTLALAFSFLFSAWGNVIAAEFCPRYSSNQSAHHKTASHELSQVEHVVSCHSMDDMEMSDMQMDESEMEGDVETSEDATLKDSQSPVDVGTVNELAAIAVPLETCGHCWMHSQPAPGAATLLTSDPAIHLLDTQAPVAVSAIALPNAFTISVPPSEHGPPGYSLPRHVLINVFRI